MMMIIDNDDDDGRRWKLMIMLMKNVDDVDDDAEVPPPLPAEAKLSAPGFARASAIRSFTFFAGTPGCTTSTNGSVAISEIGWKSLIGS